MKLFFNIILFTLTIPVDATTFYIDPSGSDKTGTGTFKKPWATLSFACTRVINEGDVIHLKPGTYVELLACKLTSGVSIEGEGINTIIKSHYDGKLSDNYDALIQLVSGNGAKGNQHISNLKLDGDKMHGDKAIAVYRRSNVTIHDCTIVDFYIQGIRFGGGTQSGNSVFNNIINNCAGVTSDQHACLSVSNNTGMQVFDNTIIQKSRQSGKNGTCVESWEGLKDFKFYNNTITAIPYTSNNWSFAFEFWLTEGGIEIYNNRITGCIDFGKDVYKGDYKYGLDFHHNVVGYEQLQDIYTDGIQLEQTIESVIIRNNLFKNLERPIYFCQYNYSDDYVKDIYIYNNLITGVGREGAKAGNGIYFESGPIQPRFEDNINIWNNTIIGHQTYKPLNGIFLPTGKKVSNISVRNNIITGFSNAPVIASKQSTNSSIDKLIIEYNLFYHNGNRNAPELHGITAKNTTIIKNRKNENPLFVSSTDFHLKSGSPAIRSGIKVAIKTDYDDKPFSNPPSIGAYEYFSD
jgi:hypothetical protein